MERHRHAADEQIYPAVWITLLLLTGCGLLWHGVLGRSTVSACWIYSRWHLYCPGCGGTRAVIALLQGRIGDAFRYHPAVPVLAASVGAYLISQTLWRLRGRRGWVLRYSDRWLYGFLALLAVNCIVRNVLWRCFGVPL